MNFSEIRQKEGRISGLVALERALPYGLRAKSKKFLLLVAPLIMILLLTFKEQLFLSSNVLYGLMFLIVALWAIIFMLDAFYDSHYFEGAHFTIPEWGIVSHKQCIPFEVLEIVSHTHSGDLTGGFLESQAGKAMMSRLDISPERVQEFLTSNRPNIYADLVNFGTDVSLVSYATAVFSTDKYFADFLVKQNVTPGAFVAVAVWVADVYEKRREAFRWWGRDSLGRIKSVGKDWTQGETDILMRYGDWVKPIHNETLFKKEIDSVEKELVRSLGANVLLIADEYHKIEAVVAGLADRIHDGTALEPIEHKRLLVLDTRAVDQSAVVEGQFESLIIQLFNQAVTASHVILVIKDFPGFVLQAKKHNINLKDVLTPYFTSPDFQIIALAVQNAYEKSLKSEVGLISQFKMIFIESERLNIIIRALEGKAFEFERRNKIYFSYQALAAIAERAIAKYPNNESYAKALESFYKITKAVVTRGIKRIGVEDVRGMVV